VRELHFVDALDSELTEIERLIRAVRPQEAEGRLRGLFATMNEEQLRAWEPEFRDVIKLLLPKRRKVLNAALDAVLRPSAQIPDTVPAEATPADHEELADLQQNIRADLHDLSANHIFDWATAYRDSLGSAFDRLFRVSASGSAAGAAEIARAELGDHATEIFTKGYTHTYLRDRDHPFPMQKSLSGLQRFLDISIEQYTTKLTSGVGASDALALRILSSAMIRGVLEGFSCADFGGTSGSSVLGSYPRYWVHALAFLTADDVREAASLLGQNQIREGIELTVVPVVTALEKVDDSGYVPFPVLGQFSSDDRSLEIDLTPPSDASGAGWVQLRCYLDPQAVHESSLRSAASANVALIVAVVRPDLQSLVASDQWLQQAVVAPRPHHSPPDDVTDKCRAALESEFFRRRNAARGDQPLRVNFARYFPIDQANPAYTYHVQRSSVRELLRNFEHRNGVRLWCSVRRSGKTTACDDLVSSSGDTSVVAQTCDNTGQISSGSVLYDAVCAALRRGDQIEPTFLTDLVAADSPTPASRTHRYVFILDEYETLFGQMRAALRKDPDIRYQVVQPLLNQMVVFARDNLLVFLGQQPNAHYILMDQNQLSPYVEQDPFPLFRHSPGTPHTEFSDLVSKVLSSNIILRPGFVDAVHDETNGHPYLTVNVLREFVDWLIDTDRRQSNLTVGPEDFRTFSNLRLTRKRITITHEYEFFRSAVAQALSDMGRDQTPWLHAMYTCLSRICEGRGALSCSRREFAQFVRQERLTDLGFTPESLLVTGQQANFLDFTAQRVWPRIRILGRIAAVTPAALTI